MTAKIDSATTSDDYTDACTLADQWLSSGGYFIISDAEVYAQLQYSEKDGPQGYGQWGTEVHVPTGNGQIFKGTTGIRFRSFTAGAPATISAAIFSRDEPTFIIGSGGISSAQAVANLHFQENGTLIGTENTADFEDATPASNPMGVLFTLTDDSVNTRVKIAAALGIQIIWGNVASNGTKTDGFGFTSSRSAAGTYTISITTPFTSNYAIALGYGNGQTSQGSAAWTAKSLSSFGVRTTGVGTGTLTDEPFSFIAIGI